MTTKNKYPNPVETQNALQQYKHWRSELDKVQDEVTAAIPKELEDKRRAMGDLVSKWHELCKAAAEIHGGYKGGDGQCYWQKRDNGYYDPRKLRNAFYWAGQAIHEVVDEDLLKGYAKQHKVTEEHIKEKAWEPDIRRAFILK